jgi:hypothetical protein
MAKKNFMHISRKHITNPIAIAIAPLTTCELYLIKCFVYFTALYDDNFVSGMHLQLLNGCLGNVYITAQLINNISVQGCQQWIGATILRITIDNILNVTQQMCYNFICSFIWVSDFGKNID